MEIEIRAGEHRNVQTVLRKFLYGSGAEAEAASRAMTRMTQERVRAFEERRKRRQAARKLLRAMQAPFIDLLQKDEKAQQAARALSELARKQAKQKPAPPFVPQHIAR